MANRIVHIVDGEAALDYLFQRGDYTDPGENPRPHVILLDLRLPKVDGLEVLKEIKTTESLCTIPVVILTTSAADRDVAEAYDHHANSYLVKPVEYALFIETIRQLGLFLMVVEVPRINGEM